MVNCPRVLFNRELVLEVTDRDMFVEGDVDSSVLRLCKLLGWYDDLMEQNQKTEIRAEKAKEEKE